MGALLGALVTLGSAPAALAASPTLSAGDCPTSDGAWTTFVANLDTSGETLFSDDFGSTTLPLFVDDVGGTFTCAVGDQAEGFESIYEDFLADQTGAADPVAETGADGFGDGQTIADYVSQLDAGEASLPWDADWAATVGDSIVAVEEGGGLVAASGIALAPIALGATAFVAGWELGSAIRDWLGLNEPGETVIDNYPALATQVVFPPSCILLNAGTNPVDTGESKSWCESQGQAYIYINRPYQLLVNNALSSPNNAETVSGGVQPYSGGGEGNGCGYSFGTGPPDVADPNMIQLRWQGISSTEPYNGGHYGGTNCIGLNVYAIPFTIKSHGTAEPDDSGITITSKGPGSGTGTANGTAIQGEQGTPDAAPVGVWIISQIDPADVPSPGPGQLFLPAPFPNEIGTDYETRVEDVGFATVHLHTVSEDAIDPAVGPDAVTNVVPSTGVYYDPATVITVDVNPDDAPNPSPGSSPPGSGSGGAFTPPAVPPIVLPSVATPCNVFPFGIPCWLVGQLGALTADPVTPDFNVDLPWSQSLEVNLGDVFGIDLGTVMAYIRPILLFASFLGIMVWLAGFALGGSTGGSGGGAESEE